MNKLRPLILIRNILLSSILLLGCKQSTSKKSNIKKTTPSVSTDTSGNVANSVPSSPTIPSTNPSTTTPQYQTGTTGTTTQYPSTNSGFTQYSNDEDTYIPPTISPEDDSNNNQQQETTYPDGGYKDPDEFIFIRESYIFAKNSKIPVLFIADNQFNNNLGRASIIRTTFFDTIKKVAIRPPLLDKFAPFLMEHVIRKEARNKKFIIHLGDLANVSCTSELDAFRKIIKDAQPLGWVMTPGNHDMAYMGQAGANPNFNKYWDTAWLKSCQFKNYDPTPGEPVRKTVLLKDNFVKNYISSLKEQNVTNPENFPINNSNFHCTNSQLFTTCEFKSSLPNSFLQRVYAVYPKTDSFAIAHRAWIIQEVNLKFRDKSGNYFRAIIADSTNYTNSPALVTGVISSYVNQALYFLTGTEPIKTYNAGLFGEIRPEQINKIDSWVMEKNDDSRWMVVTHHHWKEFERETQNKLSSIREKSNNLMFLSAHTHHPFFKTKTTNSPDEINIGSVTDNRSFSYLDFLKIGKKLNYYLYNFKKVTNDFTPHSLCDSTQNMQNQSDKILRYDGYHNVTFGSLIPEYIEDHTLNKELLGYLAMYVALDKTSALMARNDLYPPLMAALSDLNKCKDVFNHTNMHNCMRAKHGLIKKFEAFEKGIMATADDAYKANRLTYGSCQAVWASQKEAGEILN